MIPYFRKRAERKRIKELMGAARHARNMREDIAKAKDMGTLRRAEETLLKIRRTGRGNLPAAAEALEAATNNVYPKHLRRGVREHVEMLIVTVAVVVAIHAFFLQPFKIPTGSMQPTLNGIKAEIKDKRGFLDHQPMAFFKWLLTGESCKEVRAKASGKTSAYLERDNVVVEIGGVPHKVPVYMRDALMSVLKPVYNKGDVIIRAKVVAGDHIFVNKMKYNFTAPSRGDIAVFDTRNILHDKVRKGAFYIKRMVGLTGERIQIQNGRIVADGQIVSDPPVFEKIATDPAYHAGHSNAGRLASPEDALQLADGEYLMCGDNTLPNMSLDGRFFGGVPRADLKGPAFFVYWPFREHWGPVR